MGRTRSSLLGWASGVLGTLATLAGAGGCAKEAPPPAMQTVTVSPGREQALSIALDDGIRAALEKIAVTDPRFSRRLGAPPSDDELRAAAMKALTAGDSDVSVEAGTLDFFSFTARSRGLDQAAKAIALLPDPPIDHAPPEAVVERPRLERDLATRLVAEERARLDEERSLPRGASALVRGIVETWTPLQAPSRAAEERDEWLAKRLDLIRGSLSGSALPRGALLELDDALNPLERIALPEELPASARAMAELRLALGDAPSALGSADDARHGRVETRIKAHLGIAADLGAIRARLETAERATRALAKDATSHAEERSVAKKAEELTFASGRCDVPESSAPAGVTRRSRVRSMAPPPERAAICGALQAVYGAHEPGPRAAVLVALHDEVVVGLWALALHADGATPERAIAAAHPFYGAQPEREARLVRFGEANPIAAIGAGLAAELVSRGGAEGLAGVTERWLTFGEAPLDVIERELFAGGATAATAAPAPASPPP